MFLIIALASLILLLTASTPSSLGNLLLFYVLLIMSAFALTSLVGLYVRRKFGQRELLESQFTTSVRQGVWFAIIFASSFLLLHQNLFSWINATLLILVLVFLEGYLITRGNQG